MVCGPLQVKSILWNQEAMLTIHSALKVVVSHLVQHFIGVLIGLKTGRVSALKRILILFETLYFLYKKNRFEKTHAIYTHSSKLSDEFHTYGLYWSADRLYTYFDDPSNIIYDIDLTTTNFWEFGQFSSVYNKLVIFISNL